MAAENSLYLAKKRLSYHFSVKKEHNFGKKCSENSYVDSWFLQGWEFVNSDGGVKIFQQGGGHLLNGGFK